MPQKLPHFCDQSGNLLASEWPAYTCPAQSDAKLAVLLKSFVSLSFECPTLTNFIIEPHHDHLFRNSLTTLPVVKPRSKNQPENTKTNQHQAIKLFLSSFSRGQDEEVQSSHFVTGGLSSSASAPIRPWGPWFPVSPFLAAFIGFIYMFLTVYLIKKNTHTHTSFICLP